MPAADAVFELARDPAPVFREVTGQLTTLNREPLTAAKLYVEATGQSVPLDWSGSFRFSLASNTPVLVAVAEGFDTIYLDASRESELQIALANQFSNRFGEVRAARAPRSSLLVPARASLNQPFENFQAASLGAEVVERLRRAEVSFLVDRAGLVKQVAAGPGVRLTPLELARAEELLTRGPAWPERYRRASWRYTVVVE